MIPSYREVAYGLFGAWRLLLFKPDGMRYFDRTPEAFWKSFFAIVLCFPGMVVLALAAGSGDVSLHGFISNVLVEMVSWVALPVILHAVCDAIGRQRNFIACVVALNWSRVFQTYLVLPFALLSTTEATPGTLALLLFAISLFLLVYEGYVFYRSLEISGMAASSFVALDILIELVLIAITRSA